MAFDEQAFRKAAAAEGYSEDEINSHVQQFKPAPQPEPVASAPAQEASAPVATPFLDNNTPPSGVKSPMLDWANAHPNVVNALAGAGLVSAAALGVSKLLNDRAYRRSVEPRPEVIPQTPVVQEPVVRPDVADTLAQTRAAKQAAVIQGLNAPVPPPATVNEAATQAALAPETTGPTPEQLRAQQKHEMEMQQLKEKHELQMAMQKQKMELAAQQAAAKASPAPKAPVAPSTPPAPVAPPTVADLQAKAAEAAAANAAKPTAPVVPEAPVAEAPKAIPELAGPAPELVGPKQAIAPPVETKAAIPPMIGPSPETPTVLPPEGWREQPTTNKVKGEVVGRGAFNHLANNIGIEAARKLYQEVYGGKNVVSYDQMIEEMQKISGPPKPLPEGAKPGGSFGRPKYIPPEIKGSTTLEGVSSLANAAIKGLFGLDVARQVKQGIEEKDTPKIVNALGSLSLFNPLTAILGGGLVTPPEDEEKIKKMIYKEKVGAGRGTQGVPPP